MDAEEALRYGFINEIVPREQLSSSAMAIAEEFASMPPLGVQASKRLAIMSREMPMESSRWVADLYTALIGDTTHDAKEGPRAFVEKRKPMYTGELGNLSPEDPV
jgi:enoyl-CoA hydratase/carnithine racemase